MMEAESTRAQEDLDVII